MSKVGKLAAIAVLTVLIASGLVFFTHSSEADDSNTYTDSEGGAVYTIFEGVSSKARVTGWDGVHSDVTIQTSITKDGKTYPVKDVSSDAFKGTSITSVVFPDSASPIDIMNNSFEGCASLRSVSLGTSVTLLGNYLFRDCTSLESVTCSSVSELQVGVFQGCSKLTEVSLNKGLRTIGESAFRDCSALKSLALPESMRSLGGFIFYGCTSLTEINLPSGITSIPTSLFENCTSLGSISIPGSVSSFNTWAFRNCTSLIDVTFGEGIVRIEAFQLFYGCAFTSVSIPASVTHLYEKKISSAHEMWPSCLERFDVSSDNTVFSSVDGVLYSKDGSVLLMCPAAKTGDLETSADIRDWAFKNCSLTKVVLGTGCRSIGEYAFDNSSGLTEVSIPATVTSIGQSAFASCANLKSADLPDGLTEIPYGLFTDCASLVMDGIPSQVTKVGHYAFRGCRNVVLSSLPDPLTFIGEYAFDGTGIESISLGSVNKVTVCRQSFGGDLLKSVTLGKIAVNEGVTEEYYHYLFYGSNLSEMKTTEDFTLWTQSGPLSIGPEGKLYSCLSGYEGSVTIPSTVTVVLNAFQGCTKVTEVIYEDMTKTLTIGSGATVTQGSFNGCTSLISVTLPNLLMKESSTFSGCTSLSKVVIGTIDRIVDYMFYKTAVTNLDFDLSKTVYVGSGTFEGMPIKSFDASGMEIARYAFRNCGQLTEFKTDENTVLNTGALMNTGITSLDIYTKNSVKIVYSGGSTLQNGIASFLCQGCEQLSNVTFIGQDSKLTIGYSTFEGCTSLKELKLPDGLDSIYLCQSALKNSGLESFSVKCNLIVIGTSCFEGCSALKTVNVDITEPISLNSVFRNCTSLEAVTVTNLRSVCIDAFYGCTSLKSLDIGSSDINNRIYDLDYTKLSIETIEIGNYSGSEDYLLDIMKYTSVKEVTCSKYNSKYKVTDNAVYSTRNGPYDTLLAGFRTVTEMAVLDGVTTIGEHAFDNCSLLTKVSFPASVMSFLYTSDAGPALYSADGKQIGTDDVAKVSGRQYSAKGSQAGLFLDPVLTFVADGSVVSTVTYLWGETYDAPAVPAKTGYDGSWESIGVPTGDTVVNAVYAPHIHNVTYSVDGSVLYSEHYAYGDTVAVRSAYEMRGHTVSAWSTSDANVSDGSFVMGDSDVSFQASSTVNSYTVTYYVDGVQVTSDTYDYGTTVTVRDPYTKEGFEVSGWTSDDIVVSDGKFVLEDRDVAFTAVSVKLVPSSDGSAVADLTDGSRTFKLTGEVRALTVDMADNASISVADASSLVGKEVRSEVAAVKDPSGLGGTAYDLTFESDGSVYNGTISVTLPFNGSGKTVSVYYWTGSGTEKIDTVSVTADSVTFETGHNSVYILVAESGTDGSDSSTVLVAAVVVIVLLLLGVGYYIVHRRKALA